MSIRKYAILLTAFAVFLWPLAAHAVSWLPIVTCGGSNQPACNPCSLFETFKHFIDFILYGITGPVATFMIVLSGLMMLTGGASVTMYNTGKRYLTNTLIGVAIILLAWVGTNFLIKSLVTGSSTDNWYQFSCPATLAAIQESTLEVTPGALPVVSPIVLPNLSDGRAILGTAGNPLPPYPDLGSCPPQYKAIANALHVPCPVQNAPDLIAMANCIYADKVINAIANPLPVLTSPVKQTTVVTYLNDNPACNYTRGQGLSGCQHAQFSCHFGGYAGTNGAEAIDITAKGGTVTVPGIAKPVPATTQQLFCEIRRLQKTCPFKLLNYEGDHVHVSAPSCDNDGRGVASAPGTAIPNCSVLSQTASPAPSTSPATSP